MWCFSGHVRFIDYEYSSYNYQAFDIGNHFNEFAGLSKHSMMWIWGNILLLCIRACYTTVCICVCDQVWLSWIMGSTPAGRCKWTGSKFTCRHTNYLPRKQRKSVHGSWRHSMYRSTSLPWWEYVGTHTHTHTSHPPCLTYLHLINFQLVSS